MEEGPRMRAYRAVTARMLHASKAHFLSNLDAAEIFSETDSPGVLPQARIWCEQLVDGVCRNFEQEFDVIAERRKVCSSLNRLDKLEEENPKSLKTGMRRPIPAPVAQQPLDQMRVLASKRIAAKIAALRKELTNVEAENATLRSSIEKNEKIVDSFKEDAAEVMQDLDRAQDRCRAVLNGLSVGGQR
jgi:hypothetical protein